MGTYTLRDDSGRWKGDKLRTYNPATDDVFEFTTHIRALSRRRDQILLCSNIEFQLKGIAKNWFYKILTDDQRAYLRQDSLRKELIASVEP